MFSNVQLSEWRGASPSGSSLRLELSAPALSAEALRRSSSEAARTGRPGLKPANNALYLFIWEILVCQYDAMRCKMLYQGPSDPL